MGKKSILPGQFLKSNVLLKYGKEMRLIVNYLA